MSFYCPPYKFYILEAAMYRLFFLFIFFLSGACDTQEPEPPVTGQIVIDTSVEALDKDPYTLQEAGIEDDTLNLEVFYGGGCAAHEFSLYVSDVWQATTPPGRTVTLVHDANGDLCEAAFFEEISFDLTTLRHPEANEVQLLVIPFQSDTTFTTLLYRY